jgi:hypothetical protein
VIYGGKHVIVFGHFKCSVIELTNGKNFGKKVKSKSFLNLSERVVASRPSTFAASFNKYYYSYAKE